MMQKRKNSDIVTLPILTMVVAISLFSCGQEQESHAYTQVAETVLWEDSVSVRALEIMPGAVAFAGSAGTFGTISLADGQVRVGRQQQDSLYPEFRALAHTASDFFMLSAGDPALLYKTGNSGNMELVYSESGPEVFYDALAFWNDKEGIAFGDAQGDCLTLLRTTDGGTSWGKIPCTALPVALPGEGAFAASDTNIEIWEDEAWIITTKGRILYSPDRGQNWSVLQSPIAPEVATQGLYSMDFYEGKYGYAIGGDYTQPEGNTNNKMRTSDSGKTWEVVADGNAPGYKSCVQYIPGAGGSDLVAVGFTGISYSGDGGLNWKALSESSYYSIRFINDSIAYASGRGRVSRLVFRK
ncbi:Uncharacterized protein SAMN04490243_0064 [Robiginitalea myxolifaciens]|uniref:Oxidoreductase n=1 Tax=Robiginitalea myxolifaciens TaxID=400055 RepID=A0A1I6FN58_9FLAO|nr:oxidoreductase [Robiginitalea myxolifaciens]SFR31237.1 Uncharacterized protein SAMN04490243_0064 [Robiginitalea myxolifaciens]